MLTQEELKKALHYDPLTGIFTWLNFRKRGYTREATCRDSNGYTVIRINGKNNYGHRLAFLYMTGALPNSCVDHMDRDKGNTKWDNLREATYQQNSWNRITKNSKSKEPNIEITPFNKYRVRIRLRGENKNLGSYSTLDEAIAVRNKFRLLHRKEYAPK